jgi:hypothetical protein
VYPFPSSIEKGILCSVVAHVLKEKERCTCSIIEKTINA